MLSLFFYTHLFSWQATGLCNILRISIRILVFGIVHRYYSTGFPFIQLRRKDDKKDDYQRHESENRQEPSSYTPAPLMPHVPLRRLFQYVHFFPGRRMPPTFHSGKTCRNKLDSFNPLKPAGWPAGFFVHGALVLCTYVIPRFLVICRIPWDIPLRHVYIKLGIKVNAARYIKR